MNTSLLCAGSSLCGGETLVWRKPVSGITLLLFSSVCVSFGLTSKSVASFQRHCGETSPPPLLPPPSYLFEIWQKGFFLERSAVLFCSAAHKVCGGVHLLRRGSRTRLVCVRNRILIHKRDEADTSYYKSLSPCHLEGWAHANECN